MAIDFPLSPSDGQVYTVGSKSWTWNALNSTWDASSVTYGPQGIQGTQGIQGIQGVQGLLGIQGTSSLENATTPLSYSQATKTVSLGFGSSLTTSSSNLIVDSSVVPFLSNSNTFSGSLTATSFIKTSGTSAQFLKADGSIDSTTYLSTSTASSTYAPIASPTFTGTVITPDLVVNGTLVVNGITTTLNSNTLSVDDKNIELGSVTAGLISTTGTVGSITGTGPWTATISNMTDTADLIPGSSITATSGTGSLGSGGTYVVASIVNATSITYTATGGTTPTAGTVTNITGGGASDATANGGGITLKGTTDKSISWLSTSAAWTSSEKIASTVSTTGSSTTGAFAYGTMGYSDQNTLASFVSGVNAYNQVVIQNTANNAAASSDLTINNNLGTATTYYVNLGMNSSSFTGTGSLNIANAGYLTATTGDLVLGTTTSNPIHFVVNSGTTDALTIATTGVATFASAPAVSGGASTGFLKANGSIDSSTYITGSSPTITTPVIDTINTSLTTTGTASLWNTGITTGTIAIGGSLTTGTINIATGGTGITNINIGHTNSLIGLTGNTIITGTVTGNSFIPTSSTVPVNGMYLSTTNTVSLASATTERFRIDSNGSVKLFGQILEPITVSATAAATTVTYDVITNKNVLYYTTAATANWTFNIRGSATVSLNTLMDTGQSITVVFMNTSGATAYYPTALQIDGTAVTPKWQGGTAPTAGNTNSVDAYSYTVIKTGSAAYTVLASQTKFA